MSETSWVILKRDIEAIAVPFGSKMTLPEGSQVRIEQASGGNYTVVTDLGVMCRVNAEDADAIGQFQAMPEASSADANAPFHEDQVWERLKQVYDPEIPVNIVDLGLIYELKSQPLSEGGNRLDIKMTMTAPGCGMGEILKQDVARKAAAVPGVKAVNVEIVFEPQWSLEKMSEAARLQLGL
jgi:probable FeS assembly SUF system protein SufT